MSYFDYVDKVILYISIISLILFIINEIYVFKKYKNPKDLDKKSFNYQFERFTFFLFAFLMLLYMTDNKRILERKFSTIDKAIKATKAVDSELIVDRSNDKLYIQRSKEKRDYFIEYKKENNSWRIVNKFFDHSPNQVTRWKYNDSNDNILYLLNIDYYEIDNKLVVYMRCQNAFAGDYCSELIIKDNQENEFIFKDKEYVYKVFDDISKNDYFYYFDNVEFPLKK